MRSVLLTFVFSVPIFLQSADTVEKVKKMTINDALCGAYNHDKNKAAREETEAGHEQYVQARAGMLPTLGLQGNYSDNKKENSGDLNGSAKGPRTKTKRGSVVLSQNIFEGGKTFAKMDEADATIKKSWSELQKAEQTTLKDAATSYLDIFAATQNIDIAKGNLDFSKQQFESTSEKQKVGEETITNVKAAEAQYFKGKAEYEASIAQLQSLKTDFKYKTNLEAPNSIEKPNINDVLPKTLDIAQDIALSNHYAIKSAENEISIVDAKITQVSGSFLPKIDLEARGDSSSTNTAGDLSPTAATPGTIQSKDWQLTLSASIPIYEAGANRSQLRQVYKKKSSAQIGLQTTREQLKAAVKAAWIKVKSLEEQVDAYRQVVAASKMAVNGLMEEHKAGSKTILDVLQEQTKSFNAQKQYVESEKEYFKSVYELLFTMGILNVSKLKLNVTEYDPSKDYAEVRKRF
ncbi:MAG: TolC family outer membrane protein [Proteobacteria bacterium]|nr:TolC family outer membrane protein [Pseudomonadota bacterium]